MQQYYGMVLEFQGDNFGNGICFMGETIIDKHEIITVTFLSLKT